MMKSRHFDKKWRDIQLFVNSPRMLAGLPPFAAKIARRFYDVESSDIAAAVNQGDVALFVALLIRLDQLHIAAVAANRSIAEIAPIVRCKGTLEGYMARSAERLKESGGSWPLSDP